MTGRNSNEGNRGPSSDYEEERDPRYTGTERRSYIPPYQEPNKTKWTDILPLVVILGSVIVSWSAQNSKMTMLEVNQTYQANELQELKEDTQSGFDKLTEESNEMQDQINSTERTVTQIYNMVAKKRR